MLNRYTGYEMRNKKRNGLGSIKAKIHEYLNGMLQNHELKDKILNFLIQEMDNPKKKCSPQSMSALLKVSKERARTVLQEIAAEGYCAKGDGYGGHEFECTKNEDTEPFLKSGGYTKRAREEYWEKFPKKKWFIYEPLKYIIGIVIGAILTLLTEHILLPQLKSPDNKEIRQGSTNNADKEPLRVPQKDTSKKN